MGNTHLIKWGETLTSIARKYDTTVKELAKLNNIKNVDLIIAGKTLQLPVDSFERQTPVNNVPKGSAQQVQQQEQPVAQQPAQQVQQQEQPVVQQPAQQVQQQEQPVAQQPAQQVQEQEQPEAQQPAQQVQEQEQPVVQQPAQAEVAKEKEECGGLTQQDIAELNARIAQARAGIDELVIATNPVQTPIQPVAEPAILSTTPETTDEAVLESTENKDETSLVALPETETKNVNQAGFDFTSCAIGAGSIGLTFGVKPYFNSVGTSWSELGNARYDLKNIRTERTVNNIAARNDYLRAKNQVKLQEANVKIAEQYAKNPDAYNAKLVKEADVRVQAAEHQLAEANADAAAKGRKRETKAQKDAKQKLATEQAKHDALKNETPEQKKLRADENFKREREALKDAVEDKAQKKVTKKATKKAGKKAVKAATKKATQAGAKVLGKVAVPLTVAAEGYSLYSAYNEGEEAFKKQCGKTAVVATCAAAGAAIGVWFFGVGALPGAGIGAAVGEVITWFM